MLFQRFSDAPTERIYLRSERVARGPAIRALILIAIATFIFYLIMNPLHFPREGVRAYTAAAIAFILILSGFYAVSRTEFYLAHGWIDAPIFALMFVAMAALAKALADQAPITGIAAPTMALIQMGLLVVFASVAFAATVRLFFLCAGALLAMFAAWLLMQDVPSISKIYNLTNFSTFLIFALYFNWEIDRRARDVFATHAALDAEREKTEELLYNVLPQAVAARLKAGEAVADAFSDVTVVFADLVGFSSLAKRLSPGHLVKLLNSFFSAADNCAERHGVEKVKTIGDAYLAVCGGMSSTHDVPGALRFARDLMDEVSALAGECGIDLKVRIGIHTGPVVGGVIGSSRLSYDYWGDTMNIASRLQDAAPPNRIAVSEATYFQTKAMQDYDPQTVVLKGIGDTQIYVSRA
ncbi:MAG TPA: adenylate/guanylate cyclase domain-containing protein [Sphingomicrobium sp.]|nr:adenylate/guanylate cyclase domain-containing protein [Sphingomicrobium sp.]